MPDPGVRRVCRLQADRGGEGSLISLLSPRRVASIALPKNDIFNARLPAKATPHSLFPVLKDFLCILSALPDLCVLQQMYLFFNNITSKNFHEPQREYRHRQEARQDLPGMQSRPTRSLHGRMRMHLPYPRNVHGHRSRSSSSRSSHFLHCQPRRSNDRGNNRVRARRRTLIVPDSQWQRVLRRTRGSIRTIRSRRCGSRRSSGARR